MKATKALSQAGTRNYGIDALRILSMFMVLVLHILGKGGVINAAEPFSGAFVSAWTMEAAAYCAVNCYGLISGYVGIRSRYSYTNLVLLWLQVALYSVVGTAIFFVIAPGSVGGLRMLTSFFPVYNKYFWYFSAYFGMYLLIPLINRAVLALNRQQAKRICLSIFVFYSIFTIFINNDPYVLKFGYSVIWLTLLYTLGACIREFDLLAEMKSWKLLMGYLLSVMLSLGWKLLIKANVVPILAIAFSDDSMINYTSPTMLLCGIALLMIFARWSKIPGWIVKVIRFAAPVAFGVYIIHMHENINELLFKSGWFEPFAKLPALLMVGAVLLSAIVIFVALGLIDKLRGWLFRVLRLKQRLLRLEEKWLGDLWN